MPIAVILFVSFNLIGISIKGSLFAKRIDFPLSLEID